MADAKIFDVETEVNEARKGAGKELERLLRADVVVKRCDPRVLEAMGVLERSVHLASAYEQLEAMIDQPTLMKLARLMNSPLGFMCDRPNYKSKEVYSPEVVKRCIIEALLYGVMPIGNEFNIIADRCYVTRNGYTRKLNECAGLTDLRINFGVPKTVYGAAKDDDGNPIATGAIVKVDASWRIDGVSDSMDAEIPIKMNKMMGLDAVIGKADRKIKYRIWCRITGSTFTPEGEFDEDEVSQATSAAATPSAADKMKELEARKAARANGTPNGHSVQASDGGAANGVPVQQAAGHGGNGTAPQAQNNKPKAADPDDLSFLDRP